MCKKFGYCFLKPVIIGVKRSVLVHSGKLPWLMTSRNS